MFVYLDASFLVALLLKSHAKHQLAYEALKDLSKKAAKIFLSTLTIDECWYILYSSQDNANIPFSEFSSSFSQTIEHFLNTNNVIFPDKCNGESLLRAALKSSVKFNLRPRDAFHYAYASDINALFYTLDSDFEFTDLDVQLLF